MVYVLLGVSVIFMFISNLCFSPGKYDSNYKQLFQKNFPKLESFEIFSLIISLGYYTLYSLFLRLNYIDSFDNPMILKILLVLTFIIFYLFFNYCKDEIINANEDIKSQRFFLVPSIIIYIISFSFISSFIFVHFTNSFLDFRNKEECVVDIVDRDYRVTGSGKSRTEHYELFINPDLYRLNKLEVSSSFYNDSDVGNKLKLYICKGLYGIKYIDRNMNLLK